GVDRRRRRLRRVVHHRRRRGRRGVGAAGGAATPRRPGGRRIADRDADLVGRARRGVAPRDAHEHVVSTGAVVSVLHVLAVARLAVPEAPRVGELLVLLLAGDRRRERDLL